MVRPHSHMSFPAVRVGRRATVRPGFTADTGRILAYLANTALPLLAASNHHHDSRWEILVYVALYALRTDGLTAAQRNACRGILADLHETIFADDVLVAAARRMDPSLVVTGLYVRRMMRSPVGDGALAASGVWRRLRDTVCAQWSGLRSADVSDANNALLVCNAVGSARMLRRIIPRRYDRIELDGAVFRRYAHHWRRLYRPPAATGGRADQTTIDAVYFATHLVFAFTDWGSHRPAAGALAGPGFAVRLRPERTYLASLAVRPRLVDEIGVDAAGEVLLCMPALGVSPLPPNARIRAAVQRWQTERDDSRDRRGGVNLNQVHYLQHVAVNLLYAMRTCG
jgi:hypothetical protein